MKRNKPLKAAESAASTAADASQALLDDAVSKVTPHIEQAAEFASDTYGRVQPHLQTARKRGSELASDAYDRFEPALKDAHLLKYEIKRDDPHRPVIFLLTASWT